MSEEEWYEDDVELSYEPDKYTYRFEDDTTLVVLLEEGEEELIKLTIGHKKPICCAFSAKEHGPLIAVGFADGSVFVAGDLKRMYEESTFLNGHKASVLSVAFHKTEAKFVSVSLDGKFVVHECKGPRQWIQTQVVASRIGLTSVCWHSGDLIVGSADGNVSSWKYDDMKWVKAGQSKIHNGYVRMLERLPKEQVVSAGDDMSVVFMSVQKDQIEEVSRQENFSSRFESIKWHPDDQSLRLKCEGGIDYAWRDGKWMQLPSPRTNWATSLLIGL